jgi:hypothetical protein
MPGPLGGQQVGLLRRQVTEIAVGEGLVALRLVMPPAPPQVRLRTIQLHRCNIHPFPPDAGTTTAGRVTQGRAMTARPGRTERTIGTSPGFHPVTWTFDEEQVETIWADTEDYFNNKLWVESMVYGVFYAQWQQEVERRAGRDFFEVLVDAVCDIPDDPYPGLVFLGFQQEFARYRITTEFAPHPVFGDVLSGRTDYDTSD